MSNLHSALATEDIAVFGDILAIVLGQKCRTVTGKKWDKLLDNDRQRKTNYSWYYYHYLSVQRQPVCFAKNGNFN